MKKILSVVVLALGLTVFSASYASANTWITDLSAGTNTYYKFIEEDFLGKWSVYFETRSKVTSNYAGTGSGAVTLGTYYTRQISSSGADGNIIHKGATYLVDSYNEKTYTYNTACHVLYDAQTLTLNKTVGWSSSKNPYLTYPLKPGVCSGQNYVNVNHVYVNRK